MVYYIDCETDFSGMDFSQLSGKAILFVSDKSMVPGPLIHKMSGERSEVVYVKTTIENALPASICERIYRSGDEAVIVSKNKAYDKEITRMTEAGISVSRTELSAQTKKKTKTAKPESTPAKTDAAETAEKKKAPDAPKKAPAEKTVKKQTVPAPAQDKAPAQSKAAKAPANRLCEQVYKEMCSAGIRKDIAEKFRTAKPKDLEPLTSGSLEVGMLESEVTKRIVMLKPIPTNDEAKACLDFFFGKGKYTEKEKSSTYASVIFSLNIWRRKQE